MCLARKRRPEPLLPDDGSTVAEPKPRHNLDVDPRPAGAHDFEARITRRRDSGPIKAGWRGDFSYPDDEGKKSSYIVLPIKVFDEAGQEYAKLADLPDTYFVRMAIINDELRKSVHRARIRVGTKFLMSDGRHVRADGVVTRITGLFDEP